MRLKPSPREWVLRSALMWVHQHKYPISTCQGSSGTVWCLSGCFAREVIGFFKGSKSQGLLILPNHTGCLCEARKVELEGNPHSPLQRMGRDLYLCMIFQTTGRIKLGRTTLLAKIIFKEGVCAWPLCGTNEEERHKGFSLCSSHRIRLATPLLGISKWCQKIWKVSWATLFIVNEKKLEGAFLPQMKPIIVAGGLRQVKQITVKLSPSCHWVQRLEWLRLSYLLFKTKS